MSFEILHRHTKAVLYTSATATEVLSALTEAVRAGANLQGADLQDAYFRGAYLRGADLRDAYLRGANLRGADLRSACLQDACLQGADLRGAYLQGAYLQDAYLQGAYLRGAYLQGAYLQGAYLRGADLQGAKGITPKVLQIGGSRDWVIVHKYGQVQIGCMQETLEWWEDHYRAVGRKEDYTAEEVEEYREHIAACRRFMERYGLLVEPAAEPTMPC